MESRSEEIEAIADQDSSVELRVKQIMAKVFKLAIHDIGRKFPVESPVSCTFQESRLPENISMIRSGPKQLMC